jgi:hypothetical protein
MEQKYRFWCVADPTRLALNQLMGIPLESIGLIPREALFPTPQGLMAKPSRHAPMTFVFGGRLSATKNLDLVIRTVSRLQMDHGFNVQLALFGEFDNQNHPDRGRWPPGGNYRSDVEKLIVELDWRTPPKFVHGLGPEEWYLADLVNPVYFNLSTFVCEDFDVSLAQAQALGWPALISDWGGHRDVHAQDNVLKIHPSLIGHAHEGEAVLSLRAKNLSAWIAKKWDLGWREESELSDAEEKKAASLPDALSLQEIDRLRRSFIYKTGEGTHRIYREGLDGFSYEPAAERFFATYRALFTGRFIGSPTVILINDFNTSGTAVVRDIRSLCEAVLAERLAAGEDVVFVPIRESLHPHNALLIAQAREVIVPFWTEAIKPLLVLWAGVWNLAGSIKVFVEESRAKSDRGQVQPLLRHQDAILYYGSESLSNLDMKR